MKEYNLKHVFEQIVKISRRTESFSIEHLWKWTKFNGINEHLNKLLVLHEYSGVPIKGRNEFLDNQNVKGNFLLFDFIGHLPEYNIKQYDNFKELVEVIISNSGILNGFTNLQIPIINGIAKDILFALEYKDKTSFKTKLDNETMEKIKQKIVTICLNEENISVETIKDRKSIENLDKKWFDFTIKFVDKLTKNKNNWDSLSEKEQELAALWKLEADMYNGGFIQFFCNWGYECFQHAIRCLTQLKAEECLNIVQQQYKIIERLENDKRIKELWDIPKYLTEEEKTKISDELNVKYWNNSDNIIEKTFKVYKEFVQN